MERPHYEVRYRDGYYVVVDAHAQDKVQPSDPGHYKRYRDGYLYFNSAHSEAQALNNRKVPA